jgi:hypothetical protein
VAQNGANALSPIAQVGQVEPTPDRRMARTGTARHVHSPARRSAADAAITPTRFLSNRATKGPARCASGIRRRAFAKGPEVALGLIPARKSAFVLSLAILALEMLREQHSRLAEPLDVVAADGRLTNVGQPGTRERTGQRATQPVLRLSTVINTGSFTGAAGFYLSTFFVWRGLERPSPTLSPRRQTGLRLCLPVPETCALTETFP